MVFALDDLRPNKGSNRPRKRVGRGHGSGHGKTSGRGTKGQGSRSGPGIRRGFEGGQLPLQQKLPYKRGFTNIYKTQWEVVNLHDLEKLGDAALAEAVTPEVLLKRGIIRGLQHPVKLLGTGELARPLTLRVHATSSGARDAVTAAGGTIELLERTDRWVTARPRTRRMQLNSELKRARVGKIGGQSRAQALADRNTPVSSVSPTLGMVRRSVGKGRAHEKNKDGSAKD